MRTEVLEKIDFKNGTIKEISKGKQEKRYILDVSWKRNVHFIFQLNTWGWYWYFVERNGEKISASYRGTKYDGSFFKSIQHLVNEIENGDFNFKKTVSEQIADIICERQLTSYMNNTKWKEFLHAMDEEMSIKVPYDYKTLFEEDREELWFGSHYDRESFNNYYFKSLEWVKVKSKFYESKYRGRLIEDEKIYYDVEEEFIGLMKKYSISCEYDEEKELYTIYGYK